MSYKYELRVTLPSDTPVVGCEIVPSICLVDVQTFAKEIPVQQTPIPEHHLVFVWSVSEPSVVLRHDLCRYRLEGEEAFNCRFHKSEVATFQCMCCVRLGLPARESYHCTKKCFLDSWQCHLNSHDHAIGTLCQTVSGDHVLGDHKTPVFNQDLEHLSYKGCLFPDTAKILDRDHKSWVKVGSSETYVPVGKDVNCILRLECVAVHSITGDFLVPIKVTETNSVIIAPEPHPRNMIGPINVNKNFDLGARMSAAGGFRVLSYNVLANMYATREKYSYCPTWALIWEFRRQRLLLEIVGYEADILCLQEVQSNHVGTFFGPELNKHGYSFIFAENTLGMFVGEYVTDGCATFFRRDRFSLVENYKLEFKSIAMEKAKALPRQLNATDRSRFIKDNIALIVVLQSKEDGLLYDARLYRDGRSICVANVHIAANPRLTDIKLFQVKALLESLEETYSNANMPILICSDLNSLPESAPYNLVVTGKVDPCHEELLVDPIGIMSQMTLYHKLPQLASAYSSFFWANRSDGSIENQRRLFRSKDGEPDFTNFTENFKGTIDYIFYTVDTLLCENVLELVDGETLKEYTALPSSRWPSDHIAIMASFRFKPKELRLQSANFH